MIADRPAIKNGRVTGTERRGRSKPEGAIYFTLLLVPPWYLPRPAPPWPEASGFIMLPFIPSLFMPVVSLVIEPFSMEFFSMPGLSMLLDCGAGPVEF